MNNNKLAAPWQALFAVLVIASLVLGACSQPTEAPLPPTLTPEPTATAEPTAVDYSAAPFVGPAWYWLSTVKTDGSTVTASDPSNYYLGFVADGTYNGKADCNNIAGGFTLDGANLTFLPGISTLMACPEGSQDIEFTSTFNATQTYRLEGDLLYLDGTAGSMTFSQQPTAPAAQFEGLDIVGKVWQWLRFEGSDGATTFVPNPANYVVEFGSDGTYFGTADCNSISGGYTSDGSAIKIEEPTSTRVACPEGSLSDEFIQRLVQAATYVIQDGVLFLNQTADAGNMVMGQEPVAILPPAEEGQPGLTANDYLNVRSGPGTNYPVFGVMPTGRSAQVAGKSADGLWWALNVPLAPLGLGWVSAEFATAVGAESVPVMAAPPVPPTAEFTQPGSGEPTVTTLESVYVRSGPGEMYPVYGVAAKDALAGLVGRSQDSQWWVVRVNPAMISAGTAWVPVAFTSLANVTDLQSIAVVEAPPPPEQTAPPAPPAGAASGVAMATLNVRSGPGTQYPILAVVMPGTVGEITGKSADGAWWQVRVPTDLSSDGVGWVSADFVYATNTQNVPVVGAPETSPVVTAPPSSSAPPSGGAPIYIGTTTDSVNVYKGPGKDTGTYGVAPAGTTSIILERSSDGKWLAFALPKSISKDGKGWINASYVNIKQVNSATATAMAPSVPLATATNTPKPGTTPQPSGQCKVESVKPVNKTVKPNQDDFDMVVVLKNTSGSTWNASSFDLKYLSGDDFHVGGDVFDLPADVAAGDSFSFALDLKAPSSEGTYDEKWAFVTGSKSLCTWTISIVVVK